MKRREFVSLLGLATVAWPLAAGAQPANRARRIGVIMNYGELDPEGQARVAALRERLRNLGWTDGSNARIEVRWAAAKPDLMERYTNELISLPADVIVVNSTPLLAVAKRLNRSIPMVFVQVADPVGSGFVANYNRPGGNITGFTDFDSSIAGKWVEVLKEAIPSVRTVAVLLDPKQGNHHAFLDAIEKSALALKVDVSAAEAHDRVEIEQALAHLSGRTDRALIVLPGPVNNTSRVSIIALAARYRLPAVYPFKYYVEDGGLLYYGIDQLDQWRGAASYVDRILRGETPGALPLQAPTRFELIVNLKAAKSLNLSISPTLLARADKAIE